MIQLVLHMHHHLIGYIWSWTGCDFNAASTASTVTTIQNENEIKIKYTGGQDGPQIQTQTTHPTTPVIDSNDKIDPAIVGLLEINIVQCVFSGIVSKGQFYYHVIFIFKNSYFLCFFEMKRIKWLQLKYHDL